MAKPTGIPTWRLEGRKHKGSVFYAIDQYGNDIDFEPVEPASSTEELAGSQEKVEVMRRRVERGESCFAVGDLYAESDAVPMETTKIERVFYE